MKMIDRMFLFAGGSVGGLHKSMTRLSSSQQINQNGGGSNTASGNHHSSGECFSLAYSATPRTFEATFNLTKHYSFGESVTNISKNIFQAISKQPE